ncbi:MAG TPA: hypothetical protein PKK43_06695 [Spirochaetota bacterium]|nr:hypothetical protein [Spirochaetota bacterium]
MMKFSVPVILTILSLCVYPISAAEEDRTNADKKIPVGEIVFATTPITKGSYSRIDTSDRFRQSDKIYARAFFRENVGELRDGESGFVDLTIDGRFIKRLLFTNRDIPKWSMETQLFISNTGQDDFEGKPFVTLDGGEHEVSFTIGREFMVENDSVSGGKRVLSRIFATGHYILESGN